MLQNSLILLAQSERARLIYQDQVITARQLAYRVNNIMQNLETMHKEQTKPIAFCMPNSPELLCWYLACFYKGITIVPIIYENKPEFIQQVLQLTRPDYLLIASEKQQELSNVKLLPNCKLKINDETHQLILANQPEPNDINFSPSNVMADQLAMVIFSSGTSGVLKGIQHSYQSAYGFMETLVEILAVKENLTYLVAQPMGHIGGIVTTLMTLLYQGTVILLQGFKVNAYMQMLSKYQPTHLNLHTPLFYEIINYPNINKDAFSRVTTCFAGGDTIPTDLPAKFTAATGARMQTGYGMTETGIVVVNWNPYDKHAGSCGTQINTAQIELRDTQSNVVKQGETGEIWIKSPGCCLGYWNMDVLNKKTFSNGWFRTHDLACLDEEGYYWYRGRDSQVINRDGHLIYLESIEKILFNCPAISSVAVIAIKDVQVEKLIAFVELNLHQAKAGAEEKILNYAMQKLQDWELPEKIVVLDKLPLNLTGKIDRGALAKLLETHKA